MVSKDGNRKSIIYKKNSNDAKFDFEKIPSKFDVFMYTYIQNNLNQMEFVLYNDYNMIEGIDWFNNAHHIFGASKLL